MKHFQICTLLLLLTTTVIAQTVPLEADAQINRNYDFVNTKVYIDSKVQTQETAVDYLAYALEQKGWTVYTRQPAYNFDLFGVLMIKQQEF